MSSSSSDDDSDSDSFIGPPRPSTLSTTKTTSTSQQKNEPSFDLSKIPLTNEVELRGHSKAITALSLDPSGSRLLSGSNDYEVKFWDFAGMDVTLRPFRTVLPCEGHQISSLQFSLTGDCFLVAPNSPQAKVYDRDGFELCEFSKGDQYLRDLTHTKGHVAAISKAVWHPTDREIFITCSADSTVRIWDLNETKKQKTIIKTRNVRGARIPITTCNYNINGRCIIAACQDGTFQLWNTSGNFARPDQVIKDAHESGSETSSIQFAQDGHTFISRGGDHTLKFWDTRKLSGALHTVPDLPNYYQQTDCIFSPDDSLVLTGISVKKSDIPGKVFIFDKATFKQVHQIELSSTSAISLIWHKKINQILVGCADTNVHLFYDPDISTKGAKLSVVRGPKKKDIADEVITRPIYNPHSLPLYKAAPSAKRRREKELSDPVKSHKPDLPVQGPGHNGRIGSSLTQHLMKNLIKKTDRNEDPREALLKYAKEAEENPYFFRVYKETQPEPIFDYSQDDDEEAQEEEE